MTQRETRQLASGYSVPTLRTVTRVLRPSFPLIPSAPASSESYSGPLHNLLPPRRYCLCRVRPLIAVSRQEMRRPLACLHLANLFASVYTGLLVPDAFLYPFPWYGQNERFPSSSFFSFTTNRFSWLIPRTWNRVIETDRRRDRSTSRKR